jgi:hypothetical protein
MEVLVLNSARACACCSDYRLQFTGDAIDIFNNHQPPSVLNLVKLEIDESKSSLKHLSIEVDLR